MAQVTKDQHKTAINSQFPTNGTGQIGASRIRTYLGENLGDSVMFLSDHLVDDDTFATASPTTVPSSESVKAYVDGKTAGGTLTQGTWTPTLTNVSNLDSSSAPYDCFYIRVGDLVHCYGWILTNSTSTGVVSNIGISLPVASNLANATELVGGGASGERDVLLVVGDATNNRAQASWTPTSNSASNVLFHFMYKVI